jgi:hypothetical protein
LPAAASPAMADDDRKSRLVINANRNDFIF